MKKLVVLLAVLALQFCGSQSEFEQDFGTDTLIFTSCIDPDNNTVSMISTVQYDHGDVYSYVLAEFEGLVELERNKLISILGDIIYSNNYQQFSVIKTWDGSPILNFEGYSCYE